MTAIRIATSLVLGIVAGTAAVAAEPKASTAAPAATVAATGTAAATTSKRPTRYCFVGQITGSLIQRKSCDTRKGWEAQGVDLDAALAKH